MFDPAILKRAGLGPSDVARLTGVTRVAATRWLNGTSAPGAHTRGAAQKLVDVVTRAVEAGELPVPVHVTRRERLLYIKTVLATYEVEVLLADD